MRVDFKGNERTMPMRESQKEAKVECGVRAIKRRRNDDALPINLLRLPRRHARIEIDEII